MARITVIGAGLGGLCAALRLVSAGHDVTVCEASGRVGGKLNRWSHAGFTFDTGPSLLTMPQVLAELFSDVGERLDDHLALRALDPITRSRWPDGTQVDTSGDAGKMARDFDDALGGHAAADWARMMDHAAAMWRAVEEPVIRAPSRGWRTFAPLVTHIGDLARLAPHETMRGMAWRYLRDPRQRMMLDRYATYTGSDPRRAPAALLTIPYIESAFGGWYVEGGLYRIAEVVADLAIDRGADIRLATPVAHLIQSGSRVAGVRLESGEPLRADAVVANVDARVLYGAPACAGDKDGPGPAAATGLFRPPARRHRWDGLARARSAVMHAPASSSGFVLLLGVAGSTPELAHHNVWFPTDYDAEFDRLFGAQPRPVDDPTIYISRPDDPTAAPPGHESWFVLVNAPRHAPSVEASRGPGSHRDPRRSWRHAGATIDWCGSSLSEAYGARILDVLAQRGLDVRDRVVVRKTVSPADLARATGAPGGAIYGSSSNGVTAAFLRPANRSPVRGLFLVGGSAHPGGGLPLVTLSAAAVADLIGAA